MINEIELMNIKGGINLRTISSIIINAIYIIKTLRYIIGKK